MYVSLYWRESIGRRASCKLRQVSKKVAFLRICRVCSNNDYEYWFERVRPSSHFSMYHAAKTQLA